MEIFSESVRTTAISFTLWYLFFHYFHGLGITLGYHRLVTHNSLKVPNWLRYFFVTGGYLAIMGGPISWAAIHRLHHLKSDMPGDPHSPRDGFWHALMGWMFDTRFVQSEAELQRLVPDLMKDPYFKLLGYDTESFARGLGHAQICIIACIVYRLLILLFFGWTAFIACVLATFVVFFGTQAVNAVCHLPTAGYRTYQTRDDSRNVWWVGLLAMGEGWHNNHHAMMKSARHGLAWFEIDVTWYTVWLLEKLGLAKNVIRPIKHRRREQLVPEAIPMPTLEQLVPEPAFDSVLVK